MHRDAFKHYREEERYEVGLAAGRLNSLLASQAFLFTGWAIIHGSTGEKAPKIILVALPSVALIICACAFMSIGAAVVMIHRLQRHGARLISEDQIRETPPELMDFHVNRSANDTLHFWGVDVFSIVVPFTFSVLWLIILVYSLVK